MNNCFSDDAIAELLGLTPWIEYSDQWDEVKNEWNSRKILTDLNKRHKKAERELRYARVPERVSTNVKRLAEVTGLNDDECKILEFVVLLHTEPLLDNAADLLGSLSSNQVFAALAVLLNIPESNIRTAMNHESALSRSGLISIDRNMSACLRSKLDLLSSNFADTIVSIETDPLNLLREMIIPSTPAELTLDHFSHLEKYLTPLLPYFKTSLSIHRRGVNLFLYGAPGTGKTQLAKVLAQEMNCELYEVSCEDSDGDAIDGNKRLRAFRAAQSFLAQRRAMILFDEVEDVFNDGNLWSGRRSTAQKQKAWINRILEDNTVPTLWLSNTLSGLDPAFARRFDSVVCLPIPPKDLRIRILQESCGDILDQGTLQRIAEHENIAPALITKTADVVRTIRTTLGERGAMDAFETLLNATLEAQGYAPVRKYDLPPLSAIYDPGFINADVDLNDVTAGVLRARTGRLCLYGPPGTGKTEYARWLASQLDMPLLVKRASDLLSKWVGESEQNIAQAFRQAENENAVLLIDEVDGLLRDRRSAQHSFEVTQVNEMLTGMESFPGLFIASTNLREGLDAASLRRFDLKVRFDYLRPDQAWKLFCRYCEALHLPTPNSVIEYRLARLSMLAPGDFAMAMRQTRFRNVTAAEHLLEILEAECALKEGSKNAIGFV